MMAARGLRSSWESIAKNSSLRRLVSANVSAFTVARSNWRRVRDVPDIALNDGLMIDAVEVADEFDFRLTTCLTLKRQILIADVTMFLEFLESGSAGVNVLEQADLPEFLSQEFFFRVA